MRIKPFRAWRPAPAVAGRVATLPYDVVDTAEARRLADGNPDSFFHVSRSEIDLPDETDLFSDAVYAKAAENFRSFRTRGVLTQDGQPSLYLYRLVREGHEQVGLVAVCHVDDYEQNVIRKHEKTRQAPENDRTRHLEAINANAGPVLLAYRDNAEIDGLVADAVAAPPVFDFVAPDDIRHTGWRIDDPAHLVDAMGRVPAAYIADGHHRAASAARVARTRRAAGQADGEFCWFLAVLFPASQLRILPYNRCVRDLNGLAADAFLEVVKSRFTLTADAGPVPRKPATISMYLGQKWWGLSWQAQGGDDPVAALDVSVLQNRLLEPVLGIDDPRTNSRIEFVGGIRGTGELERRVTLGRAAVAFSMYPATVDQLIAISDANLCMPPKSTWFEPKLRSGLFVHTLD